MRAKKANLAVHISPAKRGFFKKIWERERTSVVRKIYCITVTTVEFAENLLSIYAWGKTRALRL